MSIFHKLVDKNDGQMPKTFREAQELIESISFHLRERIIKEANLETLTSLPTSELRKSIKKIAEEMIVDEKLIISKTNEERLISLIIDETVGFGPLESLLKEDSITEIMVNGPDEIYIEMDGMISQAKASFKNDAHIRHIIERIVAPIGRRIDESSPMVDGRLPDGSRVNAVIPPVSIKGPVISIRKFNKEPLTMQNLIDYGSLQAGMAEFIQATVRAKANIVISGGTGSGKTTLLNVLASAIPANERIITIEDMAEMRLHRPNVVSLEARPANMEGTGEITIRHLVKNALRMRPDRIVVGEVRGDEAIDMLQAMNTGHAGSLTTIHANSPKDALTRLEAMVVVSNAAISVEVVRHYLMGALDLIVQIERLPDGSRKLVAISEVCNDSGQVQIKDIFRYKRVGIQDDGKVIGKYIFTGHKPNLLTKISSFGITLPDHIFAGGG